MTTKLEHTINSLTRAPHNNFAVNTLIISQFHQLPETGLLTLKSSSMDRDLESQKFEPMRKMMLMQEQVFKQQVQELHRLYNLQKKLMQEIGKGLKLREERAEMRDTTKSQLAIRHQTTEIVQSLKAFSERNDQNEPSSSNSAENSRVPIKFDLEMPAEAGGTPSSSTHPFGEKNRDEEGDVEVELTLSIGHCTRKTRSKSHLHHCNTVISQLQDSGRSNEIQELGSSSTKTDKGDSYNLGSSSVYQENTRPHWLLQDLSLNRT